MRWCGAGGGANESETKSHITYCVTAKRHIMHMGTHTGVGGAGGAIVPPKHLI